MTRLPLAAFLVLATVSGCGLFKGSDRGSEKRDPLFGRYIPKTDLPMPDRDAKARDPLYASPTSKKNSEPFRNGDATTVAGLAGNVKIEESGMSLGDRRTAAEPVRGVPLKRRAPVAVEGWENAAEELRLLRARYDAPYRDASGEYSMSATVPGTNGALRRFEASGPTAADAAKSLVSQIKSDDRAR